MDELKIRVRHVKYITNPSTGEVRIVPKSLTKLDGPGLSRLADRMIYVICRDIVPGLSEETLRSEIMTMIEGPNSNSSQSPSLVEPETKPASEQSPPAQDAGNPIQESSGAERADDGSAGDDERAAPDTSSPVADKIEEASLLSPDWQDTYLRAMTRATDRPKSLLNRHTEALQLIGGKANAAEQDWMRAVYDLRKRNLQGELSKADYDLAIRELADG
jgi:hypothetical protein